MNNESQEKEIVIGTETFDGSAQDSYWFEVGVKPNVLNRNGIRYTQFHIDMIHKWLDDVVCGRTPENSMVPLHETQPFPSDSILNLSRLCGRIIGYVVDEDKTWINVVPCGPNANMLNTYKDLLKIVTLMVGSVSKAADGINTITEDTKLCYFFLTLKDTPLP